MTEKRKIVSHLPAYNQTPALSRFFSATVDHLFQPGRTEPISGFIGQKPSYFDAKKDFYVPEPTLERQKHQLEATVVSYDDTGFLTNALFYDDLINYLRSNGALSDNQARLFETESYTFAPPIDIDKILNQRNYYWFPDRSKIPAVVVTSPVTKSLGLPVISVYPVPERIATIPVEREEIAVFVNGQRLAAAAFDINDDRTEVEIHRPVGENDDITVMRYGDLRKVFDGLFEIDVSPFTSQPVSLLTSGMHVTLIDAKALFHGFDIPPFDRRIGTPFAAEDLYDQSTVGDGLDVPFDEMAAVTFCVEMSPKGFLFLPIDGTVSETPDYVTIHRASPDENPYSLKNHWIHKDAFAWAGLTYPQYQAKRPIIEFRPGLRPYNYGTTRRPDINAVVTDRFYTDGSFGVPPFDVYEHDPVDGLAKIAFNTVNGRALGTVIADDGYVLRRADRVLVMQTDPEFEALNHKIYRVETATDALTGVETIALVIDGTPEIGDIVRKSTRGPVPYETLRWGRHPWEFDPSIAEFWFTGEVWVPAQSFTDADFPLFALYDDEGVSLDDAGRYPQSTFAGSRLFGFAVGNGPSDAVLGIPLRHDGQGDIVFEMDLTTRSYSYAGGEIPKYHYYQEVFLADPVFSNSWYKASDLTRVTKSDGIYNIPANLQANADNEEVAFISRNQFFDHFASIVANQDGLIGDSFNRNNYRDTERRLNTGTQILQHRAPLLKLMLLCSDERFSFLDAVRFAEQEYGRFKLKFTQRVVDLYNDGILSVSDHADIWVDRVLKDLRANKTSEFPFAHSSVAGVAFVPPTPAVMGLMTPSVPEFIVDESYTPAANFILGHDGSRTPVFGDLRDDVLLAFEQRIYAAISDDLKTEARPAFDVMAFVRSRFTPQTVSNYGRDEFIRLLGPAFERWAQLNRLDYRTNEGFDANNAFTWNYSGQKDREGNALPGHWRGIYQWYFDTDRPHSHPWEMLGFASKPGWWDETYGPAPYTRGNVDLWSDLEGGIIRGGSRLGVDLRYARPGLMNVLPVDDEGNLLDPMAAKIPASSPTYQQATRAWAFGDGAPVETMFHRSPAFAFALAEAAFLMKPALLVETLWAAQDSRQVFGQWVSASTHNRPRVADLSVHGEVVDGVRVTVPGIQEWIVSLMAFHGLSADVLGNALRRAEVRLAHKIAGFTSGSTMRAVAENFGLIPAEDVGVHFYQSPSVREEIYSGVIIEWVGNGWRVVGYDPLRPVFTVMPPDTGSTRSYISLDNVAEPVINEWRSNVYYVTGTIVDHNGSTYRALRSHTSGARFEADFWKAETGLVRNVLKVAKYSRSTGEIKTVPYGTLLLTHQDVADFLLGYERYLVSRGWEFEEVGSDNLTVHDFTQAVRDFLAWSQVRWDEGNFIALSPAAEMIRYKAAFGAILDADKSYAGTYNIVDRSGAPIDPRRTVINRMDGEITITGSGTPIFGARLRVSEVEHILVFSSQTIFNDTIFAPLFNLRQPRLRLIAERTTDWTGRLDAPGYILVDGEIRPNFERSSDNIRMMFDIEKSDDKVMRDYTRALVGYEPKDYLNSLLLSDTQSFEFYQGAIQQKGSHEVFDKLTRSQYVGQSRNLQFYEEWAFHSGTYGALASNQRTSFRLDQTALRREPQIVEFLPEGSADQPFDMSYGVAMDSGLFVERPPSFDGAFVSREISKRMGDLPTAGYARLDEVTETIFHEEDIPSRYTASLNAGKPWVEQDRILVYDTAKFTWDVFRVFNLTLAFDNTEEDPTFLMKIVNKSQNSQVVGSRLYFSRKHGLTQSDLGRYLILDSSTFTTPDLMGAWPIAKIDPAGDWVEIDTAVLMGRDFTTSPALLATARVLRPSRFANTSAMLTDFVRPVLGDLAFVDGTDGGRWSVYRHNGTSWSVYRTQPDRMDSARVSNVLVYDEISRITDGKLEAQPLVLSRLDIIDPVAGLIPGKAERELFYKVEYDPANYTIADNGAAIDGDSTWGEAQVGRLWWDLSAVRFVEPLTNDVEVGQTGYEEELRYRATNWGRLAPGSSVDVYEWTRSLKSPFQRIADGDKVEFVDPARAPFVERQEINPETGRSELAFYYWVKNPSEKPALPFRRMSAESVSQLISNPTTADTPWIAPIMANAMLVGGLAGYLNDTGTVLQIDVDLVGEDANVHDEWTLVRENDTRSVPPTWLFDRLRNSIVGFDDMRRAIPEAGLPDKSKFGLETSITQSLTPDSRSSVLRLRKTLVDAINATLAVSPVTFDRPTIVDIITREDEAPESLIFAKIAATSPVKVLPPASAYTHVVFSPEERDRLITHGNILSTLGDRRARILVNGLGSDVLPYWSIWDLTDEAFSLAKLADHHVESFAERDSLKVKLGEIVHVGGTAETAGMWTVWQYEPESAKRDSSGFVLVNWQQYRCTDFVEIVDWYQDGYSALNPPSVSYRSIAERQKFEGNQPKNIFVKVDDEGSGNWIWSFYDNNTWNTVARQRGTVRLSAAFYDPERVALPLNEGFDVALFANRDGARELRELLVGLQNELFSKAEVNALFFDLIHTLHADSDEVAWAFKTSFMTIAGYDEPLIQTPIQTNDNTEALVSYIEDVKPYRVKIRDYRRSLATPVINAIVKASDFDKPVYFDPEIQAFRRLNQNSEKDLALMAVTEPWATYTANRTSPLVRRNKVSIKFDRVTSKATATDFSDYSKLTAVERIIDGYEPLPGMREKNIENLMRLGFKGTKLDGGAMTDMRKTLLVWDGRSFVEVVEEHVSLDTSKDVTDFDVGGFDGTGFETVVNRNDVEISGSSGEESEIDILGVGLRDPYAEGHPEELISGLSEDGLLLTVKATWSGGAPKQRVTSYNASDPAYGDLMVIDMPVDPQGSDAVLVYRDGVHVDGGYSIDHATNKIAISLGEEDRVDLHVLGAGSSTSIIGRREFLFDGTLTHDFGVPIEGMAATIYVDGKKSTLNYLMVGSVFTLVQTPPTNAHVLITVYRPASEFGFTFDTVGFDTPFHGVIETPAETELRVMPYEVSQVYGIDVSATGYRPYREFEAVLLEKNGLRLAPPTGYEFHTNKTRIKRLDNLPSSLSNVKAYVNGDPTAIFAYTGTATTAEGVLSEHASLNNIVLFGDTVIVANKQLNGIVEIVVTENHDFTLVDGVLTVVAPLASSDRLTVRIFQNARHIGIHTHVFLPKEERQYAIELPVDYDYVWLTLDGKRLVAGIDFNIEMVDGQAFLAFSGRAAEGKIVASVFDRNPALGEDQWMVATKTLSTSRMTATGDTATSPKGVRKTYAIADGFEMAEVTDQGFGTLTRTLDDDDRTVTLNTTRPELFQLPSDNRVGVVFINGERIEYLNVLIFGNTVTLRELRRGTNGTRHSHEKRVLGIKQMDDSYLLPGVDPTDKIEVFLSESKSAVKPIAMSDVTLTKVGSDLKVVVANQTDDASILVRARKGQGLEIGTKVRPFNALIQVPPRVIRRPSFFNA